MITPEIFVMDLWVFDHTKWFLVNQKVIQPPTLVELTAVAPIWKVSELHFLRVKVSERINKLVIDQKIIEALFLLWGESRHFFTSIRIENIFDSIRYIQVATANDMFSLFP